MLDKVAELIEYAAQGVVKPIIEGRGYSVSKAVESGNPRAEAIIAADGGPSDATL